jgi:hypothetical protein
LVKNTRLPQNIILNWQSGLTVAAKVKLISLIPHSQSKNKVITVSEDAARKEKALQKTCGILPELQKRRFV